MITAHGDAIDMSGGGDVRRLRVDDAAALVSLRREALETDPLSFGASIEDDRGLSLDFVRSSLADVHEQAVFGDFDGEDLTSMVGVTEAAGAAKRMYEVAGVRSWGRQPRALHWQGRFVDEHHLVLDLREQGG